jgi:hypothetical protein
MSTMNIQKPAPTCTGKPNRRNAVSDDGTRRAYGAETVRKSAVRGVPTP